MLSLRAKMATRSSRVVVTPSICWACGILIALLASCENAWSAEAVEGVAIVYREPLAVVPGETVEMTFVGRGLKRATQLWATFPQLAERLESPSSSESATEEDSADNQESEEERVTFRVEVPAQTPAQLGALRVFSESGVSDLQWVVVDDLDTTPTREGNETPETAHTLRLPAAVEGSAVAAGSLYYRFAARRGDTLRVEALAARIGSPLDPMIRVLDLNGRAVASNDDAPGLAGDAQLACVIPKDGDYLLQLRDIRYHGGRDHRFRLRMGRFPLATALFPLGVTRGAAAELELLPRLGQPRAVLVEPAEGPARQWVTAQVGQRRHPSSLIPAVVSDVAELREVEPNDSRETAQHLNMPCAVNGRFRHDHDQDWYRMDLAAGTPIRITPRHGTLGVATRLYLELWGPDNQQIQKVPQATQETGILEYTVEADGPHWLGVEELHRRFGHTFPYRIELREERPRFRLELAQDHVDVPLGGVFVLGVKCQRGGYQGPIELEIEGLGDACEVLSGATIAKDQGETTLQVRVPPAFRTGGVQTFRVVGRSTSDAEQGATEPFQIVAESQLAFRQIFGAVEYPPCAWRQSIGLGVGPEFPPFFQLAVQPSKLWLAPGARRLAFALTAERSAGFEGEIAVELQGLPDDVSIRAPNIAAKQPNTVVALLETEALPAGDHTLQLVGRATYKQQPSSVEVKPLSIHVGAALDLSAVISEPLTPGETQTVQVTAQRWTEDQDQIQLQWRNLPAGIRAEGATAIAAGAEQAELRLTASADAEAGEFPDVHLQGVVTLGPAEALLAEGEPLGFLLTAEDVEGKGVWIEAEDFDRGNVGVYRENYGEGIGIISDQGGQSTSFAEYDLELPAEGKYRVELRYAAKTARPGTLSLNGEVAKKDAISQTTGGWEPKSQRWFLEGTFDLQAGKNVLRLESQPNMSHIDKLLVVKDDLRPTASEPRQVTVQSPPITIQVVANKAP